mmetsp:Transcript_26131/g.41535  ORF Transcript_26131/g.41535 Transcript_26131/m.41535 type:complete len:147 (-) Transcript_26131:441-881(-)
MSRLYRDGALDVEETQARNYQHGCRTDMRQKIDIHTLMAFCQYLGTLNHLPTSDDVALVTTKAKQMILRSKLVMRLRVRRLPDIYIVNLKECFARASFSGKSASASFKNDCHNELRQQRFCCMMFLDLKSSSNPSENNFGFTANRR